ncbi:MAG: response regulator [Myxococcaceae bacterium]
MTRVVVIDDEQDVCELVGKVLSRAGFDVRAALSGEAGLALLAEAETDCLVLDKQLPVMGGLEVLAEVRRRWPRLPIVLVTAHPEPFNLDAARPDAVLAKPFKNLETVVSTVREAIEAAQSARQDPLTNLRERVAAVVAEITPGRRKRD